MLHRLPDELYRKIMSYIFVPHKQIKRYDKDGWTSLCINYCYVCKRKDCALSHLCDCCMFNTSGVCENTLICWDCAH